MIKNILIAVAVLIAIGLSLLVMGFPGNMIWGIWGISAVFGTIFLFVWSVMRIVAGPRKTSKKTPAKKVKKTLVKSK
jgi:hypothetical protein